MLLFFELKSRLHFWTFFCRFGIDENVVSFRLIVSVSNDDWDSSFTESFCDLRFLGINGDQITVAKLSEKMSNIGNSASACSNDNNVHKVWK